MYIYRATALTLAAIGILYPFEKLHDQATLVVVNVGGSSSVHSFTTLHLRSLLQSKQGNPISFTD